MRLAGSLFLLASMAAQAQVDVPTPALPAAGATNVPLTAHFLWRPIATAVGYEIELAYDAAFEQLAYANGVTAVELDVADLWDDTTYYWHVRAVDALDSISGWSATRSFHTLVTGAPRPISPVDGAGNLPVGNVSFDFYFPSNPPNGFEVMYAFDAGFRGGVPIAVPSTSRTAPISPLPFDTTVYWRIRVAGGAAAGPGAWSHTMRFSTAERPPVQLGECVPILPTSGYTLEDLLVSSAWIGPSTAGSDARYQVRFSTDATMRDPAVAIDEVDTTAIVVALPDGSATWYWQVRAIATTDDRIDGPWSAVAWFRIEERVETALGAPSLLLPPNESSAHGPGVVVVWDSVTGADSYEVQVGRDSTWEQSDTTVLSTGRMTRIGGLLPDTTYVWHVRALASRGRNRGPWSESFHFSTGSEQMALPGRPDLISPENERVDLDPVSVFQWSPASGARMHILQISDDSTFATGVRDLGTFSGSATVSLEEGRRWWWHVRGVNDAGPGPWSMVRTFTTSTAPTSVPTDAAANLSGRIMIVPTPASATATLKARMAPGIPVRLMIASMTGEVVHEQRVVVDATGSLETPLPVAHLAPGIYRCRITTMSGESLDAPLLIQR
jgi:hypothetical protein